ncbi:MAG: DUF3395 domain-containing protein [Deltaproteobacteria bacterium]|nr:DUF3395 domain-containing protein [Deltaproteobacteria bacterium]
MLPAIGILLATAALAGPGCAKKQPQPPAVSQELVIRKAVWGDFRGQATADVTKIVASMVENNALRVEANPRVLGDPAEGQFKYLWVEWSKGGVVARKRVDEGKTLVIRADERPVAQRLVIRQGLYGNLAAGKTVDVTAMVAAMVEDNTLSVTPRNAMFGDPAKGQAKQLRVEYTFDGVAKSKTVDEWRPLTISVSGQ